MLKLMADYFFSCLVLKDSVLAPPIRTRCGAASVRSWIAQLPVYVQFSSPKKQCDGKAVVKYYYAGDNFESV